MMGTLLSDRVLLSFGKASLSDGEYSWLIPCCGKIVFFCWKIFLCDGTVKLNDNLFISIIFSRSWLCKSHSQSDCNQSIVRSNSVEAGRIANVARKLFTICKY